jgi:hypothetical protein
MRREPSEGVLDFRFFDVKALGVAMMRHVMAHAPRQRAQLLRDVGVHQRCPMKKPQALPRAEFVSAFPHYA